MADETKEQFIIPDSPTQNYSSILNLRNKAQLEDDLKRGEPKRKPLIAVCGINCAECDYYDPKADGTDEIGCRGCKNGKNDCDILKCCADKALKSCAKCTDFPCNELRAASEDEDASNLMYLKRRLDRTARKKARRQNSFVFALTGGALFGLVVGLVTGQTFLWVVLGIFLGFAVAVLVNVDEK